MTLWEVSTATPTESDARALARSAVQAGLAAGAQVEGSVGSVFVHQGEYGEGQEWRVSLMTSEARRVALQGHLVECHVWENPQVTWRELGASDGYADWVERVTRAG
ncbi:divalent-cation tolerance protein CutA [Pseudonocardia sp. ICBG1293]|uniref:divalent-cation tolerance protein CutA n=1 Tax=Pseudonocardia sp. ICBG1293 TaxID=2844382 RepID=UPI001CCB765D|nr:divalent cation tolerance protein CutA [Pseudonocardia sp. ICBG1293]